MHSKVLKLYVFFIAVAILVFQDATSSPTENDNIPLKGSLSDSSTTGDDFCSGAKHYCKMPNYLGHILKFLVFFFDFFF
ncbi:hypothetical protein PPACK8108_LOCUS25792 [Phakopsora pachyrhizi]|uniref:Uncharacterized protein n=1 Tax=Phakopsora pachyrhizi TaxID=170000 RepID=A0AAV0B247_PHAPC|nr:hypothetical protein PPACK8108_LOCUS10978 [Phakopsora pachyrhizi]CAH7690441.1 hypothetical protein PPACK8108_LOCUS25792 [Phakopsora pachyrhizi]